MLSPTLSRRMSVARWGLTLGIGSPFAIPLQAADRQVLDRAAHARGTTATAGQIMHVLPPRKHPPHTYFCRGRPRFVTELLQSRVNSVTRGSGP